jgi:hypothetical protein
MVVVMPVNGSGPGALRCLECDRVDPLQLPWTTSASFALQSRFLRGETIFLSDECRGLSK